ncbi:hypothetical protein SNEBB_007986 [Seison nebaliae]|nr:hypothetical protein SNEBB_007986 [Seison nebaliae]
MTELENSQNVDDSCTSLEETVLRKIQSKLNGFFPSVIIFITGGAKRMNITTKMKRGFELGLTHYIDHSSFKYELFNYGPLVFDGGSFTGVMKLIGDIYAKLEAIKECRQDKRPNNLISLYNEKYEKKKDHRRAICVPLDKNIFSERYKLIAKVLTNYFNETNKEEFIPPVILIVIEGGIQSIKEILMIIEYFDGDVIIIKNSGRASNAIVELKETLVEIDVEFVDKHFVSESKDDQEVINILEKIRQNIKRIHICQLATEKCLCRSILDVLISEGKTEMPKLKSEPFDYVKLKFQMLPTQTDRRIPFLKNIGEQICKFDYGEQMKNFIFMDAQKKRQEKDDGRNDVVSFIEDKLIEYDSYKSMDVILEFSYLHLTRKREEELLEKIMNYFKSKDGKYPWRSLSVFLKYLVGKDRHILVIDNALIASKACGDRSELLENINRMANSNRWKKISSEFEDIAFRHCNKLPESDYIESESDNLLDSMLKNAAGIKRLHFFSNYYVTKIIRQKWYGNIDKKHYSGIRVPLTFLVILTFVFSKFLSRHKNISFWHQIKGVYTSPNVKCFWYLITYIFYFLVSTFWLVTSDLESQLTIDKLRIGTKHGFNDQEIWQLLSMIFAIAHLIDFIAKCCTRSECGACSTNCRCCDENECRQPKKLLIRSWEILDLIIQLLMVLGMILRFTPSSNYSRYFFTIAIMGMPIRLLGITRATTMVGPQVQMVIQMMYDDTLKFAIIFMPIFFSFAIAFQSLFYLRDIWRLQVFNMMMIRPFFYLMGEFRAFSELKYAVEPCYPFDEFERRWNLGQRNVTNCLDSVGGTFFSFPILFFITYMILGSLLFINMLIAMYSKTFEKIIMNRGASIYSLYEIFEEFKDYSFLPPPLNVFYWFFRLCLWIGSRIRCCKKRKNFDEEYSKTK